MKVEIWSDIICPFCYIGKRRFEAALERFSGKDSVEVIWKSYMLDPDLLPVPGQDIYDYLAKAKRQSREWSIAMHRNVTEMAAEAGLKYDFDRTVVANSRDAHRLIQLAKEQGRGNAVQELLFSAYFTEGKDVSNFETLAELGQAAGMNPDDVRSLMHSYRFSGQVYEEAEEGVKLGLRGVPFFVIDRKYGASGAQTPETFLKILNEASGISG